MERDAQTNELLKLHPLDPDCLEVTPSPVLGRNPQIRITDTDRVVQDESLFCVIRRVSPYDLCGTSAMGSLAEPESEITDEDVRSLYERIQCEIERIKAVAPQTNPRGTSIP